MPIKVKEQFKNEVFGFNNSAAPLGQRDDLDQLVKDARFHKQKYILDMFEDLPTDEELLTEKGKSFQENRSSVSVDTTKAATSTSQTTDNKETDK